MANHHVNAGRIGGLVSRARQTNEEGRKKAAADARYRRYDEQVPDHITGPERAKAIDRLLRADMARLGAKSAAKRRRAA